MMGADVFTNLGEEEEEAGFESECTLFVEFSLTSRGKSPLVGERFVPCALSSVWVTVRQLCSGLARRTTPSIQRTCLEWHLQAEVGQHDRARGHLSSDTTLLQFRQRVHELCLRFASAPVFSLESREGGHERDGK